jgi:hypothetical protein
MKINGIISYIIGLSVDKRATISVTDSNVAVWQNAVSHYNVV